MTTTKRQTLLDLAARVQGLDEWPSGYSETGDQINQLQWVFRELRNVYLQDLRARAMMEEE